jgi:CHAD domain-containing protein
MAFRLEAGRSTADGLRIAVQKQFEKALAALAALEPDEESVHAARRSVKRIRAVVRMLRGPLGSFGRQEGRRLRSAAHQLASLRDADASAETLKALHGRFPAVVDRRVTRAVSRGLDARKRRKRKAAGMLARRAQAELRRSRRVLPRRLAVAGEPRAVRRGLADTYGRARDLLRDLSLDSDATRFHDWRRRVKDHACQVRLFESLHRKARTRARSLNRLDDWLGEDHNHALLRATILASPGSFGSASVTAAVLGSIAKRQARLRRNALRLGRRLFSPRPRRFRKTVSDWMPG